MAGLFGKSELSPEWAARLSDVNSLNVYAIKHKVQLENVLLSAYDLSGARLDGAVFNNTEWKKTKFNRSILANTQFRKTKLEGVVFEESELSDVLFEDVDLTEVSFFKSKLNRVVFVRCNFIGVTADKLHSSELHIIDSKVISSSFSEGQYLGKFNKSSFREVEFTDLENPSSLTFEKSELEEVSFSRSKLKMFTFLRVNADKYGFEGGNIDAIEVHDSYLGIGFREVKIGSVVLDRSKIESRFTMSEIGKIIVHDCMEVLDFGFFESTIGSFDIERCKLKNFRLPNVVIDNLRISDSTLSGNDFEALKASSISLERVILDGKIDFTNAHIEQLSSTNITKKPSLQLITTGSNVTIE